jgi:hypothetical protein
MFVEKTEVADLAMALSGSVLSREDASTLTSLLFLIFNYRIVILSALRARLLLLLAEPPAPDPSDIDSEKRAR